MIIIDYPNVNVKVMSTLRIVCTHRLDIDQILKSYFKRRTLYNILNFFQRPRAQQMQNVKANLISTQLAVIFKRVIGGVLLHLLVTKDFNLQVSFTCTVFDAARGFNCSEFNVFMCNVFCYFNFVLLFTVFLHLTRPGIYMCSVCTLYHLMFCFCTFPLLYSYVLPYSY